MRRAPDRIYFFVIVMGEDRVNFSSASLATSAGSPFVASAVAVPGVAIEGAEGSGCGPEVGWAIATCMITPSVESYTVNRRPHCGIGSAMPARRSICHAIAWFDDVTGLPLEFGEFFYWISFFGTPSRGEPWGWQLDGHHCNINCLVAANQIVLSPTTYLNTSPGARVSARPSAPSTTPPTP